MLKRGRADARAVTGRRHGEWSGGGLKIDRVGRTFSVGAVYFARQDSKPRQSLARGLALPPARRVTGGAYIKTTLPARHKARTAGRMGALFAGAAQKGKNPGIYKLTSHLVHSRVFEFFLE